MSYINVDQVIRVKRRSIALIVEADGRVVVRAPRYVPQSEIYAFVHLKQAWLQKKLQEISNRPKLVKKNYHHGETFLFLGKNYPLHYVNVENVHLNEQLLVPEKFMVKAQQHIQAWYKHQASQVIHQRLQLYSLLIGACYRAVRISETKTSWGSCSSKGNLSFNWRLIMAPLEVIDYVVIHELCHIEHPNHSQRFWQKLGNFMPDYAQHRRWLKDNQALLMAV